MTQKIIQKQEYTGSAAQSQISLFIVITVPEKSFEKMPDETNCSFITLVKSSRTSLIIPVTVTTSVKKLRKRARCPRFSQTTSPFVYLDNFYFINTA